MRKFTFPRPAHRFWSRLLLTFFIVAFVTGGVYLARRPLLHAALARTAPAPDAVLLVGTDADGRADAIFVAYFGQKQAPRLLAVPRDAVTKEGRKLNAHLSSEGPAAFCKRQERILGHSITGHLVVPMDKMPPLLDAAFPSGLSVPVPYLLRYSDKKQGWSYDIPAGRQTLDSAGLMALLRDRYSDPKKRGEAARVANWRRFFIEARRELSRPANIPRLPQLARQMKTALTTDLSANQLTGVLGALITRPGFSVAYIDSTSIYRKGKWVTTLNETAARRQARLAAQGVVTPSDAQFWVLNASARSGAAVGLAHRLERVFGVPASGGTAPGPVQSGSLVTYSEPALEALAHEVADELGLGVAVANYDGSLVPVVVVTIGEEGIPNASPS